MYVQFASCIQGTTNYQFHFLIVKHGISIKIAARISLKAFCLKTKASFDSFSQSYVLTYCFCKIAHKKLLFPANVLKGDHLKNSRPIGTRTPKVFFLGIFLIPLCTEAYLEPRQAPMIKPI